MKKTFLPALLFVSMCFALIACSNGEYSANPGGNGNGSVNPLKPLTASEFNWAGVGKFSVKINGSLVSSDSAYWMLDTSGANRVFAWMKDGKYFHLYLKDTYTGNLYNMGFKQYLTACHYQAKTDTSATVFDAYQSVLGNSGGIYINRNDSAVMEARFYCQTINARNEVVNLSEGYFKIDKF
ncbi:MAG: hypothetical protein K0Q79_3636 [Flavipsychrobacter sp.]|jgi:hypothetical protein|nr:hypothetical protein [Flavipsychrobacter sp.]